MASPVKRRWFYPNLGHVGAQASAQVEVFVFEASAVARSDGMVIAAINSSQIAQTTVPRVEFAVPAAFVIVSQDILVRPAAELKTSAATIAMAWEDVSSTLPGDSLVGAASACAIPRLMSLAPPVKSFR